MQNTKEIIDINTDSIREFELIIYDIVNNETVICNITILIVLTIVKWLHIIAIKYVKNIT